MNNKEFVELMLKGKLNYHWRVTNYNKKDEITTFLHTNKLNININFIKKDVVHFIDFIQWHSIQNISLCEIQFKIQSQHLPNHSFKTTTSKD